VKAIVDSGALGKVFMAECHWDCAVPETISSYREKKATTGGSLQDHGPHSFDLIRWWTGLDIREVSATLRSVHPDRPAEDAVVVVLEHDDGFFSYHHMTRISYGREHTQDTYRIYGTDGTLVVRNDHHFPTMSLESPEIILYRPGGTVQRFETDHGWNIDDLVIQNYPFFNQLEAFCDCILHDEEPRVTGEDGKHAMECVIGAYVSSSRGEKVRLPVEEDVDLETLFSDMKDRDRATFGYGYTIEPGLRAPLMIRQPILGHKPPRTGEAWNDAVHGLHDQAEWSGLQRRLRRKG
jgi:predicted dehydrogenase